MIKILRYLIVITAFITIGIQYTQIKKLEDEIVELEVLFEKIELRFNELELVGADA